MSGPSLLEAALACAARGWHVFPCVPRSKQPATRHGFRDATVNTERIHAWWAQNPAFNVGIACGASGLCVVDCDAGLDGSPERTIDLMRRLTLTSTYAVRTGRRPDYGLQTYLSGAVPDSKFEVHGELATYTGDIKSLGGYVMAAGSVHPSGALYELTNDAPLQSTPDAVRALKREQPKVNLSSTIERDRNSELTRRAGVLRNAGMGDALLRDTLHRMNEEDCVEPLPSGEVDRIANNACRWSLPTEDVAVAIGSTTAQQTEPAKPRDWRASYLTFEDVRDAKPTEFLIEGFLALGSITALAAPVAQRKSLIALNVIHSLCTGAPLFGHFAVVQRPERVIYLVPEMGTASLAGRLKAIGLDGAIGTTLFAQTMDQHRLRLDELGDELEGAVVILDTLTRFVQGDQNSSDDMSKFADVIFELKRRGATIMLLHHSVKGAGGSNTLTLDSAMRGSTELAAFVTCCWATKLKDPEDPYNSPSLLVNVKQRDFESKPFEVTGDASCRLTMVGEPGSPVEIRKRSDDAAETVLARLIREKPDAGINSLRASLSAAGHRKGNGWVTAAKGRLSGTAGAILSGVSP